MEGGDNVKIAVVDVAGISLDREVQPEASDFSKLARGPSGSQVLVGLGS